MTIPFNEAIVLLLSLLPGFLTIQLYRARYPAKRVSQFEIIVWSILHSFIVHLVLTGVAYILDCDGLDLLGQGMDPIIQPRTIAVLLSGGFTWGCLLIPYHWLRLHVLFVPSPAPQAI